MSLVEDLTKELRDLKDRNTELESQLSEVRVLSCVTVFFNIFMFRSDRMCVNK